MTNGIVIRLAGISQPTTRILYQEVISIGTAPDCDLVIDADHTALPLDAVILTLRRREGSYRLTTVEPMAGVTRDGEAVAVGEVIQDGDTFYFGATGIRLRFFALSENPALTDSLQLGTAVLATAQHSVPAVTGESTVASAARRRRMMPRTDVAIVFVKQLLRELVAEIPRRWLYAIVSIAGFILLTILYFNTLGFLEGRRNNKAIAELKQTVSDTHEEIERMRQEVAMIRSEADVVRNSISLPQTVVSNFGQGVCLVYGVYTFYDPRIGRDVRFKEPSTSENPIGPDGSINLSVEGNGRVYEVEFMGTGFLVDKGLILTNRHVVYAWEEDDLASLIKMRGFRPRLKEMLAYFPQVSQPYTLRTLEVLQEQDVALCSFEQGDTVLPVLPLEGQSDGLASGQQVVLLGYPAGIEGLLPRVSELGVLDSRKTGNVPIRTQLNELAASGKIRPQSSQGHISDVSPQLVYDARTDEGGSGGPVFGANGKVIGINQAILLSTQATTNFGVPIRYGLELLKKHQPQQSAQSGSPAAEGQQKS